MHSLMLLLQLFFFLFYFIIEIFFNIVNYFVRKKVYLLTSKQTVSLLGTTSAHFTNIISLLRYNLAATCNCPGQFHSLDYRFLNDSSICLQHIYKVFACLYQLSSSSIFMNKICYQLLDEYLELCLALGWRFLERYLATSLCLLLSAVCRSRVSLHDSKYSSIRRFKYLNS